MKEEPTNHYSRHRTILANERTFLAYIRTALTFFVAGITFIRFFGGIIVPAIGAIFIIAGIICFVIGILSYYKIRLHIKNVKQL